MSLFGIREVCLLAGTYIGGQKGHAGIGAIFGLIAGYSLESQILESKTPKAVVVEIKRSAKEQQEIDEARNQLIAKFNPGIKQSI